MLESFEEASHICDEIQLEGSAFDEKHSHIYSQFAASEKKSSCLYVNTPRKALHSSAVALKGWAKAIDQVFEDLLSQLKRETKQARASLWKNCFVITHTGGSRIESLNERA